MSRFEKNLIKNIEKNKDILFFVAVTIISFLVRFAGKDFVSMDYSYFLRSWFDDIKAAGGLSSLNEQVGNYGLLYQTAIAFMTYFDVNSLYQYKILSVVFDYCCAAALAELVIALIGEKRFSLKYNLAFTLAIMLPTSIANGAYWGQCDSIYTFFLVLTVLFFYKEKYKSGLFAYGLAFAFKLQAIFLLPFIICCWIVKKKFSILNLWISLVTFWSSGFIAYLNGRDLLDCFRIYFGQANDSIDMFNNFPSFWLLFNKDYMSFKHIALYTAVTVIGIGLYMVMNGYKKIDTGERLLNTAVWFVWTATMFMPNMHERYAYVIDIMLIGLSCIDFKYTKFAAVSIILSTMGYGTYLVSLPSPHNAVTGLINFLAWAYFGYSMLRAEKQEDAVTEKPVKNK